MSDLFLAKSNTAERLAASLRVANAVIAELAYELAEAQADVDEALIEATSYRECLCGLMGIYQDEEQARAPLRERIAHLERVIAMLHGP